tara:strand:+ start:495 stop:1286 length:792 start_codon:yes stop_codon:yes gene_type:complete
MLVGNYSVLQKSPGRFIAGSATSAESQVRSNFNKSGSNRNRFYVDQTTVALSLYAVPTGTYPEIAWVLPQVAGEIASTQPIQGAGTQTGNLAGGLNAEAALDGAGDITSAVAQLIISMAANLAGDGTVSAADLRGFLQAAANLSGSGDLTATVAALAWMSAATDGSGSITNATPYATGELSANIFSYSALTPEGISNAVWAQIIEAGYSASDLLQLITASAAGKLSGAPGSPIQITGVDGSTVRINATVDGVGNRTAVTYNVS